VDAELPHLPRMDCYQDGVHLELVELQVLLTQLVHRELR
jgi:hypothetical protein